MGWTYPEWTSSVEEDIRNRTITNRYYSHLPSRLDESLLAEKEKQQKKLEEALNLHTRIQKTVRRIRNDIYLSATFLILPLLLSLIMLEVSDFIDTFWSFVFVSVVVLMSSVGIMYLIKMVLESAVRD
jgi:ABC-type protease/lipase transport system fused ATPase/permease subunit